MRQAGLEPASVESTLRLLDHLSYRRVVLFYPMGRTYTERDLHAASPV